MHYNQRFPKIKISGCDYKLTYFNEYEDEEEEKVAAWFYILPLWWYGFSVDMYGRNHQSERWYGHNMNNLLVLFMLHLTLNILAETIALSSDVQSLGINQKLHPFKSLESCSSNQFSLKKEIKK